MKFRTAYDKSQRFPFATHPLSLTRQSMSAECDINNIMKKYERTGILDHQNRYEGGYGDFTSAPENYHEAMNQIIEAQDMFLSLPAQIRKKFANDPGNYLEFATDPANAEEMIKLGLAVARKTPVQERSDNPGGNPPDKPQSPSAAKKTAPEAD